VCWCVCVFGGGVSVSGVCLCGRSGEGGGCSQAQHKEDQCVMSELVCPGLSSPSSVGRVRSILV
jgi:hypothetical protein